MRVSLHVVLNREDVDLPVGQARRVGLLPLRANGVIHPIAFPFPLPVTASDFEVVLASNR